MIGRICPLGKGRILWYNVEKGRGEIMAKKRSKRRQKEWMAVFTLSAVLAILLLVAFLLPDSWEDLPQATLPPETTGQTVPPTTTSPFEPNPYTASDFQYDGRYLTCLAGESVLGIDVSAHQGVIDWQQVADAGVSFVMIRAGYRGYEEGLLYEDRYAQENYRGAKAAGLQVGAYFFSQAVSVEEALEEAQMLLDIVSGWEVDLPLVFDWEYISASARTAAVDRRTVTDCTMAFSRKIRDAGYEPMIYFNPHLEENFIHLEELADNPFWLALYTDWMNYPYRIRMWQYTSQGKVPGIETAVDMNLWFPE